MFDVLNVAKKTADFKSSEQFDGYSRVVVEVTDDLQYTAGTDTGRTLTVSCPFATEETAENILRSIHGYQYQPFTAKTALIDPAAELGDGISVNGIYGGVYSMETTFNSLCPADVKSPESEEIDHEYKYKPKQERRARREIHGLASEFKIQADKISAEVSQQKSEVESIKSTLSVQANSIKAKVSKTGGNQHTFGWELLNSEWRIFSGSQNVLKVDDTGMEVKGKITALSGTIGGFDIKSDCISFNAGEWGGSNSRSGYIGVNGIQLGSVEDGFSVDMYGRLRAESGEFRGSVSAGKIDYGGSDGYLHGNGLKTQTVSGGSGGAIANRTVSTFNVSGGINGSLSNGDYAASCCNGYQKAKNFQCLDFKVWRTFLYGQYNITLQTRKINGVTIHYLGVP